MGVKSKSSTRDACDPLAQVENTAQLKGIFSTEPSYEELAGAYLQMRSLLERAMSERDACLWQRDRRFALGIETFADIATLGGTVDAEALHKWGEGRTLAPAGPPVEMMVPELGQLWV